MSLFALRNADVCKPAFTAAPPPTFPLLNASHQALRELVPSIATSQNNLICFVLTQGSSQYRFKSKEHNVIPVSGLYQMVLSAIAIERLPRTTNNPFIIL